MFDVTGFKFSPVCCEMEVQAGSTQGKCFQIFDYKLFLPHPIWHQSLKVEPHPSEKQYIGLVY